MRIFSIAVLGLSLAFAGCGDASSKIKTDAANNDAAQQEPAVPVTNAPQTTNIVDTENLPVFSFDKERHDFGAIGQGSTVTTTFTFTNTGESPLVISNAKGSCGCTVPSWPRQPVQPGETGTIEVTFDPKGKSGRQTKNVTLTANTQPNTKVLNIVADVEAPATPEASAQ